MLIHRNAAHVLGLAAALAAIVLLPACALSPTHMGRFVFSGTVKDGNGKPVPNAWVKVRGWETKTGSDGKWRQEQIVNCGTLASHVDTYEENDAILITAPGFAPSEENFVVKHPAYFQSCEPDRNVLFDTVLANESPVKPQTQTTSGFRSAPKAPQPTPVLPEPEQREARKRGSITL